MDLLTPRFPVRACCLLVLTPQRHPIDVSLFALLLFSAVFKAYDFDGSGAMTFDELVRKALCLTSLCF